MANTVLNAPAHSEKKVSLGCLEIIFLSQIFGILELIIILSFNFTICLIFICGILFLLIVFHIPLCNVRQPFTCNLAEITRNETVWRMRTYNVKGVFFKDIYTKICVCKSGCSYFCWYRESYPPSYISGQPMATSTPAFQAGHSSNSVPHISANTERVIPLLHFRSTHGNINSSFPSWPFF